MANQGLTRYTPNLHAGVLRQVGAKLCRTSGPPGSSLMTPASSVRSEVDPVVPVLAVLSAWIFVMFEDRKTW